MTATLSVNTITLNAPSIKHYAETAMIWYLMGMSYPAPGPHILFSMKQKDILKEIMEASN